MILIIDVFSVFIAEETRFAIRILTMSVQKYVARIVEKKEKTPMLLLFCNVGTTTSITPTQNISTAMFMMFSPNPFKKRFK